MKIKPLSAALAAAGVLALAGAGTAGAIDLTPNWLKSSQKPAPTAVVVSDASAPAPATICT